MHKFWIENGVRENILDDDVQDVQNAYELCCILALSSGFVPDDFDDVIWYLSCENQGSWTVTDQYLIVPESPNKKLYFPFSYVELDIALGIRSK